MDGLYVIEECFDTMMLMTIRNLKQTIGNLRQTKNMEFNPSTFIQITKQTIKFYKNVPFSILSKLMICYLRA